jgi:hypothetical protein
MLTLRSLTLAVMALAATAAGGQIRLDFALDPAQSLPGIPVTFRVRAINMGSAPATLKAVTLRLERRDGDQWVPITLLGWEHRGWGTALPQEPIETEAELQPAPGTTLAPGAELVLDYLAGPTSPPWLTHPDLLRPGVFQLRLVTWSPGEVEEIISNEVTLTIQTPTGQDAGAWDLIKGSQHIMLQRGSFAEQLWSLYPDSIYTSITPRGTRRRGDYNAYLNNSRLSTGITKPRHRAHGRFDMDRPA